MLRIVAITKVLVLTLVSLLGCMAQTQPPVQPSVTPSNSSPPPVAAPVDRREQLVQRLLAEAYGALQKDQLTTPVHDNAVDRYRAVLVVAPGNRQAEAGLVMVARRYTQLGQSVLTQGARDQARLYLAKARELAPSLPEVAALAGAIQRQPESAPSVATALEPADARNEVALPLRALSARDSKLSDSLQALALKVQRNDNSIVIVSRSDAEGRWIYQEMKKALPGYRLRGDIRIGKIPKIVLEDPLP